MRTGFVVAALVLLLLLAVPTVAMTTGSGGDDTVAEQVDLSPSDGPNGKYATVEDGELRIDFEGLNDRATTTADDVFEITVTGEGTVEVWVTTDSDAVTTYAAGDTQRTSSPGDPIELTPGETLSFGFAIDTHGDVPDEGTVTVGVRYGDEPVTTPTETPTETPPPASEFPEETVVTDPPTGVEIEFDDPDVDEETVTVEELDEWPPDGPQVPPRAVIDRARYLSGLDDDGFIDHESKLVTNSGQTIQLTGTPSTIYGVDGIARTPRGLAIVSVKTSEDVRNRPATVRITVDREKFGDSDTSAARVGRHTEDGWQLLPTRVVEETSESVVLEARTPGFSVFAVFAEADVDYEWTLPDGSTHTGEDVTTAFDDPGYYDVDLTVTDAMGQSSNTTREIVVNDTPEVAIEGAENGTSDGNHTLSANVTNEVGNVTVTWTLPDGSTTTGEQVTGSFGDGAEVSVTVVDEFGASASDRAVIALAPRGAERPLAGIQLFGVSMTPPIAAAIAATTLVAGLTLFRRTQGLGILKWIIAQRRSPAPRIVSLKNVRWNPQQNCLEIENLEIRSGDQMLQTVEITISSTDGSRIARKSVEVVGSDTYTAKPERVPIYGDTTVDDTDALTVGVRAVDERDRVEFRETRLDALAGVEVPSA